MGLKAKPKAAALKKSLPNCVHPTFKAAQSKLLLGVDYYEAALIIASHESVITIIHKDMNQRLRGSSS